MATALIVEDESPTASAHLDVLCGALGVAPRTVAPAELLVAVAQSDVSVVILGDHPRGMCFHEVTRSVVAVCTRVGRPSPTIVKLNLAVLHEGQPATAAPTDSAPEDVLDVNVLDTLAADLGDESVVTATVEVFMNELPADIRTLTTAILDANFAAVRESAHSLKSSSAILGATCLSEFCAALEATASAGGPFLDAEMLSEQLQGLAAATSSALAKHLAH